jgi:dihydroxy-acid dehydratase
MVGHVAPEAFAGGPIAAIEDGDRIEIDIADREMNVDLTDEQLDERLSDRSAPEPSYDTGVLAKYGLAFGSAANGAVTNPGVKRDSG